MAEPLPTPALPCPECRQRGLGGRARIGNRRDECATCNAFAQAVYRLTRKRLVELHRDEYDRIRLRVELDLFGQLLADRGVRRSEDDSETEASAEVDAAALADLFPPC